MSEKILSRSPADTEKAARKLAKKIKARPWLILLHGQVGAGKTQWVKGLIHELLGEKHIVTSPSYSLVNAYKSGKKEIFHADLYRLNSVDDLESIGFWDFLEGKHVVVVEWGELLPPQWPKNLEITRVDFEVKSETERELVISSLGSSGSSDE